MGYEFVDEDEKTICFGSYCDCGYGAQPGRKMGTVPKLRS